jgi:hypothetical protein
MDTYLSMVVLYRRGQGVELAPLQTTKGERLTKGGAPTLRATHHKGDNAVAAWYLGVAAWYLGGMDAYWTSPHSTKQRGLETFVTSCPTILPWSKPDDWHPGPLQTHHCHNTMLTLGRAAMGGVGEEGERMGGG